MAGSGDWPIRTVPLDKLLLDTENVRIRGALTTQPQILSYLFTHEDVLSLVRDISRDGYFDNEQPMVIAEGDSYVVLEGNRRVSALKALLDPRQIPMFSQQVLAAIARADDPSFPSRIRVMVAPDRAAALRVIARLHTRNSKKSWIREQQAVFYYDRWRAGATLDDLRAEFSAEPNVRDFVVMGQMMSRLRAAAATDPVASDFIDSDQFKITTFEYLYDSRVFRTNLGMTVTDGVVEITGRSEEFLRRLFIQVLLDMKDKRINTRTVRVNAEGHPAYVASLLAIASGEKTSHDDDAPDADEPNGSTGEQSTAGSSGVGPPATTSASGRATSGTGSSQAAPPAATPTRAQHQDPKLDFNAMPLRLTGIGMRIRYEELQRISLRTLPNATMDVLRSFIECAIKEYFSNAGDPVVHPSGGNSPVQLTHCLAHLGNRLGDVPVVASGLVRLRTRQFSNPEDYYSSAVALNDSNHEPNATFTPEQVNRVWAQIKPLVTYLLAGPTTIDEVP